MGKTNLTGGDLPLGLGMALAMNIGAMEYFTSLPDSEQKKIVDRARSVKSKKEMQSFVDSLAAEG